MVEPVSVLTGLATMAAGALAKSGYAQAKGFALGSEQERALHNVLEPALLAGLDEATAEMDSETAWTLHEVFEPWFNTAEVQEELLAAVIEVRDPDLGLLREHYDMLAEEGSQALGPPFDLGTLTGRFREEVHANLGAEISEADSKLVNKVNSERIYRILANQQAETQRLASHHVGSLPNRPERLVGRGEALDRISENIISSDDAVVETVAVGGLPGIGKTTTLSEICNREDISEAFGNHRVWASLGLSPDPLAIISGWSRSLGGPDLQEERSSTEAANRLRAFLAGRKVLVVVDDVYDAEDAHALRILSRGVFLVSSRSPEFTGQLASSAANAHCLEALSPEDSVTLVFQEAPSLVEEDRTRVAELAGLLGGLPLFLKVVAAILESKKRSGLDLVSVVEKVQEGETFFARGVPADLRSLYGEQAKTLHALLWASLEQLGDQARRAFSALGAMSPAPSTFDLEAAGTLWDSREPEELVQMLVDQGLAQAEGEGRFSIHPVLAAWAKTLLDESSDRAEIYAKHTSHYMGVLEGAGTRYFEGAEGRTRATRRLEVEGQNILRGWSWAEENRESNDEATRLCIGYPEAASKWFQLWLNPSQQIDWAEAAIEASRRLEDTVAKANNLNRLAYGQFNGGNTGNAIETCRRALELVTDDSLTDEDRIVEARIRGMLGAFYRVMGRVEPAEELLRRQIALSEGESQTDQAALSEAGGRGNLVPLLRDQGKYAEALREMDRSYEIYQRVGDYYEAAGVRSSRGTIYHERGDLEDAEREHLAYRYMALQMNNKKAETTAMANLGNVKHAKGEHEEALRYYEEHLKLVKAQQPPEVELGKALALVARAQAALGPEFDESFTFENCLVRYKSGLELLRTGNGNRLTEGITLTEVAELHRHHGRPTEALEYTEAALGVFEDLESSGGEWPRNKADALFESALSRWDSGNKSEAIEYAKHAHRLLVSIDHPEARTVQAQLEKWDQNET